MTTLATGNMDRIKLEDYPTSVVWAELVRQQDHADYAHYVPSLVVLYKTIIQHDPTLSMWSKCTDVIMERHGTQSYQINRYYKINDLIKSLAQLDLWQ